MRGTTVYDRGRPGESREIGETWIAPDGRLWDRSSPDGKGPIRLVLLPESEFGGSGLTIQELRGLPAEPKALAARLEQLKGRISPDGPDAPLRIETVAFDRLAHPALGPAQRASVFRLLAADPRMQVTEGVTDWAGRRATRISYDDRYGHVEVLMDPATTELTSGLSRFSGQEDLEGQAEKGRYSIESRSDQVRIVPVPDGLLG